MGWLIQVACVLSCEAAEAAPPAIEVRPVEVRITRDRPAAVFWGAGDAAIVYLHGRCGDPGAARAWARQAMAYGTVVGLRGDIPCHGSGRTRWELDPERLADRVLAAVHAAGRARGKPLDAGEITLVGYSQGAARAEALAAFFPDRFSRVVLVSGPEPPAASHLAPLRAAALLAGERDRRRHLERAAAALSAGLLPVRYWMLPRARHGQYGPRSGAVFDQVFAWLFERRPPS